MESEEENILKLLGWSILDITAYHIWLTPTFRDYWQVFMN